MSPTQPSANIVSRDMYKVGGVWVLRNLGNLWKKKVTKW
jgi:hypothetical protein